MYLPKLCIKRPVLATVINLVIILVGILSFLKLPLRHMPDITMPIVTIESNYIGSSPSYIEQNITTTIENYIKNIKNIDYITSSSSTGASQIRIAFKLDTDLDKAQNDVRSKVEESKRELPNDMDSPIVTRADADSHPSIWITATSDKHDTMELTDIVKQRIKPVFEQLNSVNESLVFSSSTYAIQIKLDPVKMYQYNLSPMEVRDSISSQSRDYPTGTIKSDSKTFTLILNSSMNNTDEFANIIVKNISGNIIKLKDIAQVTLQPLDPQNIIRYNSSDTVAIGITKDSTANILDLADEVDSAFVKIQENLPKEVTLHKAYDASHSVRSSINSVYFTALKALILVLLIVYLFLGSIRATIAPFVAIPVSLIGGFAFMDLFGFSLNIYTLLAMIMAIGLVVDDAIVMLENVYYNIEKGDSPFEAALKASDEIGFVIVATTITLFAVFLPIGFIDGFVGKLFIEFAWTLAFCVLISGVVALSLSPMLCAKVLKKKSRQTQPIFIISKFQIFIEYLTEKYEQYLSYFLKNPAAIIISTIISIIVMGVSFNYINKEFMPEEDDGVLLVSASGPEGSTIYHSIDAIKEVEEIIKQVPELRGYFFNVFGNSAFGYLPLIDWGLRDRSHIDIIRKISPKLQNIPEMTISAISPGSMRGSFEKPVRFNILSFQDFDELEKLTRKFKEEMEKEEIFLGVQRDIANSMPTLSLKINRDMAAKFGVFPKQIGSTLQLMLSQNAVADFNIGNEKYNVVMSLQKEDRNSPQDLSKIYVKSMNGDMIHLSKLAHATETSSIKAIRHYNTSKSIELESDLKEGYTLDQAKDKINQIGERLINSSEMAIEYVGDLSRMDESNKNMLFTFGLALVFIYLVLSAQFESFLDPLIIILAVPFSITGALIALIVGGSSLNLYSNIGIVTLIGLITKNSILIVEFANQLKRQNKEHFEAIIIASKQRLRPILMTTIATIFGSFPLILASGASANSRSSIGLVIAGGMLLGTLFTLFVIPSIYYKVKK